jgi:hypothetical protein
MKYKVYRKIQIALRVQADKFQNSLVSIKKQDKDVLSVRLHMNQRRKRKNFARNGIKLAGSKVIKITVRR